MSTIHRAVLGASLLLAAGCTSGNTGVPPDQRIVNPALTGKLQFAVGTANIAGTPGLNTVATYRNPNATTAALFNTPSIIGPAGFTVPAAATDAGGDAGTSNITGTLPPLLGTTAAPSTFGTSGGVTALGFQPTNSTTSGAVSFSRYALPFYVASTAKFTYLAGPPAFPNTRDGNYATGFNGWTLGFTDFAATPVAGTYGLSVVVPTGFNASGTATSQTVTTSASLNSVATLPTFAPPVFTADAAGGGTIALTVPAGVVEAYAFVVDRDGACYPGSQAAPAYYAIRTTAVGPQTLTLPPNLGPTAPGFANTRTICSGDRYRVYAAGFDYPVTNATFPSSTAQLPAITGGNGQADITTSAIVNYTY